MNSANYYPDYRFGRFLIIFLLLSVLAGLAQDSGFTPRQPPAKIDKIVILGNKKTEEQIIRYQVDFTPGDTITANDLQKIEKRVFSLNLFNKVKTYLENFNSEVILFIEVTERVYLFPVPYFRLVDQSWKKINFGLGIAHYNLFGLNQKLIAVGWLGYNPGFSIAYKNPWAGKSGWIYGASLLKTNIRNRVLPIHEDHSGGSVFFGKNFSMYSKMVVSFNADRITLTEQQTFYPESDKSDDINYKIMGSFTADHRDYHYYPVNGYFVSLSYYYAFWKDQNQNYQNISLDLRYYHKLGKNSTLGLRTLGIKRTSHQPVNDYLLLGYKYRLRGYFYQRFQGSWLNISTISYRFPLLPVKYFTLPAASYFPESSMRNLPFGISLALFLESGFLVDDIYKLNLADLKTGIGAGLLFHLPYVNIFRLDFAVNDRFDNFDIIFQIGVAF